MTTPRLFLPSLLVLAALAFPPDARAATGDVLIGISTNLWLAPREQASSHGNQGSMADRFSGGISLIADCAVWDYVSLGGLLDINGYEPRGARSSEDDSPQISFMGTARGYYPFGDRGQFLPYLRFAAGFTVFAPPISAPSGTPSRGGWSVKVLPGFQYTFPFNLGVFAEIGWAGCGYGADLVNHMFHSSVINFGVTYTFAK